MQKSFISQSQVLKQKLTFQNIQLFKLMELNLMQFDQKVKEELEINPALENLDDYEVKRVDFGIENNESKEENSDAGFSNYADEIFETSQSLENTSKGTDNSSLNYNYSDSGNNDEEREFFMPVLDNDTLITSLNNQLQYLDLSPEQMIIGEYIIGSIDDDGYIRRSIENICDDISFRENIQTTDEKVEEILKYIQAFEPAGIASRNLQECLTLQLKRKKSTPNIVKAIDIITDSFELFTKKQNERIIKRHKLTESQFDEINKLIVHLNPKPTEKSDNDSTLGKYIIPDFFLYNNDGKLELELHSFNQPNLSINADFVKMLKKIKEEKKKSKAEKEAQEYVVDKINKANQFLTLIKERQETMIIVMNTIMDLQKKFFITGDEMDLNPMALKHIAALTNFDISTVSRITNSKYIQTEFGVLSLKFFFSEGMTTEDGTEVSNRKIMKVIEEMVKNEDKKNPLSDDQITLNLEAQGYIIARRTTAKYRDNLNIPPKHYRKLSS